MKCIGFELLCRIPIPGARLLLSRRHVDRCPRCRQASESWDVLPPILVRADQLPPDLDLWPGIQRRIDGPVAAPLQSFRSWRWAYAAAMLLLAFFAGYLAFFLGRGMQPHPSPVAQHPNEQIRLCAARIADRPARVFRVQSRNPDRMIYWIAKGENRS